MTSEFLMFIYVVFINTFLFLRLCSIQKGEIVCDPMCGGGTIPIEVNYFLVIISMVIMRVHLF